MFKNDTEKQYIIDQLSEYKKTILKNDTISEHEKELMSVIADATIRVTTNNIFDKTIDAVTAEVGEATVLNIFRLITGISTLAMYDAIVTYDGIIKSEIQGVIASIVKAQLPIILKELELVK